MVVLVSVAYSQHHGGPARPQAVDGGSLLIAAHSEESSGRVQACGAAGSGSHSAPPAAQTQERTNASRHTLAEPAWVLRAPYLYLLDDGLELS